MEEQPIEEQPTELSMYNEASLQIMRLHDLWLRAESYTNRGILIKWKFILDSIYRELSADVLKSQDKDKLLKRNNELRKQIAKAPTKSALYNALDSRHRFLKLVQEQSGKGSRYEDTNTEDFE